MRLAPFPAAALLVAALGAPAAAQPQATPVNGLRPPAAFADIADRAARSRALFTEAAKVLTSPRCMNCHPAGDHPTQGNDNHAHEPAVARGPSDDGLPGAPCQACHMDRTVDLFPGAVARYASIPGAPGWRLAPIAMAWQGKSIGEICRQLKDKSRNGGRDLAMLQEHVAKDQDLVAYAWNPGKGRTPAPGTQALAGTLIQAWIETGAECP
ncbi:MAG TPA: Isoquinoline 1-oxidoreductase subunit [Xanthobacteraceae bacterium]|nr:Isoquinoline 1-oxidoreductase subunit [Xanthobacteraceae bacterium]